MRRFRLLCSATLITLIVLSGAAPGAAQTEGHIVHTVQVGENLYRISLRYGVSMDAIMAASGIADANRVYVGQQLVIPLESGNLPDDSDPSSTREDRIYTVQDGDTLTSVALSYQVSIWLLVQANQLSNPHTIYAGQQLTIPAIETATPGLEDQGSAAAAPDSPPETADTYVVRAGDTLYRIALNHNTTVAALAHLNGITNPSAIYTGQVLQIAGEAPPSNSDHSSSKQIVIDLSEQHLYAYQDGQTVYSFVASSGAAPSYTRTGEFHVQSKIPNAYGATWNIWMPHWLGIYWAGSTENGIHALPILSNGQTLWAGYLGSPISYGCIVLGTYEAKLLYDWAEIGTPVTIQP